jgi:hypothetical protein
MNIKNNVSKIYIPTLIGVTAYIVAFMPYYWEYIWGFNQDLWVKEIVPIILWINCTTFLMWYQPMPIKNYWWLFISAPICMWPLIKTLITLFFWNLFGFAP